MNHDDLPEALRRHFDRVAPRIALPEVEERRASVRAATPTAPRGLLVAAAVLVVVVAVGGGLVLARQSGSGPDDGAADEGPTTSVPDTAPTGPAHWPELITATANRPEVLRVDSATGEVVGHFAPASLQDGGISGTTGAPDGRIAVWAGGRIAIEDGDEVYETTVDRPAGLDPAIAHAVRVLFVPNAPEVWIFTAVDESATSPSGSSTHTTLLWRWDYAGGDPVPFDVDLGRGLFPAGVTDDGRLVLSSSGQVVAVGPIAGEPAPPVIDGTAVAVHRGWILVRRCEEATFCALLTVEASTGRERPVDTGTVDPARVDDLLGPTVPSDSAPLPVGDPSSSRVLVRVEVGPRVPQDQPTAIAVVDLDAGDLSLLDTGAPDDGLAAAAWSCDGADVLAFGLQSFRSLSGELAVTELPEDTFLYGIGAC